jgi:uncharacterized membrane-anchored protein YitT (DUF2179 family)
MKGKGKERNGRDILLRLLVVVVVSVIFAVNYKSFIQAGDLFPGGFSGVTRLIQRSALQFWGITLPYAPINLLLNAFPAAIGFKFIGKRFTYYSCLVILLSSIFTDMIPSMPITQDILLICVFGGLINGLATCMCLWARVCGGGTDFIAIALAERKNIDAWNYILCGNAVLLLIAGVLFGWDKALYSIIFQFTTTQVVRALDPEGRRATLLIVTGRESAGGVCAQIQDTHHTATLVEGIGLYNGSPCVLIYSVVSGGQLHRLTRKIRQADPNAFVNVLRTEKLVGNFYRRPKD